MVHDEEKKADPVAETNMPGQPAGIDDKASKTMRSAIGSPPERLSSIDHAVGPDVRNYLGQKLKDSYDELVRQPVPDRFRQLLEQLERTEKK